MTRGVACAILHRQVTENEEMVMSTIFKRKDDIYEYQWRRVIGDGTTKRIKRKLDTKRKDVAKRLQAGLDKVFDERYREDTVEKATVTITDLADRYAEHCATYYRKPDGTPTSAAVTAQRVIDLVKGFVGKEFLFDFGPKRLIALRDTWVESDSMARSTINEYVAIVKRMFKWGMKNELVQPEQYIMLTSVDSLKAGRSQARETKPVTAVPLEHVMAVEGHTSRQVWALIQLQLFTGARGGELFKIRPCDIDRTGEVWLYEPLDHKTRHKGQGRTIYFGTKAQEVLREFLLDRGPADHMFSPRESNRHFRGTVGVPDVRIWEPKTDRKIRTHYSHGSYRMGIHEAIDRYNAVAKAPIPHWTPHQLRHTYATRVRREFGLEGAQVMLGHKHADVTQIYAETDQRRAIAIADKIG